MAIDKINIEKFLELSASSIVIDVRSPAEYNHAHLPGAINIPLFNDEERKTVGTAYKQINREQAIKLGLEYFAPKMRLMLEEVEKTIRNKQLATGKRQEIPILDSPQISNYPLPIDNPLLIYCWRGGMRSAGVAWLLDLYGYKVSTLAGGYKRFRNYALDIFKLPFQLKILGGYTGSGKTELLDSFGKAGEAVVNLETLANHKGSVFGGLGMPKQPSQEMFENLLAMQLRSKLKPNETPIDLLATDLQTIEQRGKERSTNSALVSTPIWVEDESQRIGDVNIPHELWKTMRRSPVYFLDIPFEERLKYIVCNYGKFEREKLLSCITRIQQRLGGLETKNAIAYLEEDNFIEGFRILLKYYDKWYFKSLHNREGLNSLLTIISHERIETQNPELILRKVQYQPKAIGS